MADPLLTRLLEKPVGPALRAKNVPTEMTRQIDVRGDVAEVSVKGAAGEADEGAARTWLEAKGLDPDAWVATGFRSGEWTMANGEVGESNRFTFARRGTEAAAERPPIDELMAAIKPYKRKPTRNYGGERGYIVALGDMQFGKIDGDGVEGTLRRTVECIDKAADMLEFYRTRWDIGHVHIAWLGDHIEGFVSQGGANVWRTPLTLNEQIRLTRRVMLHALTTFAPNANKLTMAAVPGNHGEAQRFEGKGVTRYDDSHDTESLIAVSDAAKLSGKFEHVQFFVPQTDEMTVVLDVAGTTVGHVHGHQFRPGKHLDWWKGQAFGGAAVGQADLLLAGHLHHEFVDSDGYRTFVQVPAMESESTWWRHATGTSGAPGLIVAVTGDKKTDVKEVIR